MNTSRNIGYFWRQRGLFGDPARKSKSRQCQTGQDNRSLCGCPQLLPPNCLWLSPTAPNCLWRQRCLFGDPPTATARLWLSPTALFVVVQLLVVPNWASQPRFVVVPNCSSQLLVPTASQLLQLLVPTAVQLVLALWLSPTSNAKLWHRLFALRAIISSPFCVHLIVTNSSITSCWLRWGETT